MEMKTHIKIIVGIVVILAVGFVGFQVLRVPSPDIEKAELVVKVVESEGRRITASPFAQGTSETGTKTRQEEPDIGSPEIETTPVPETVPTTQSSGQVPPTKVGGL